MAATEQLFNVRERKRFERHDIWERITENGTISAPIPMPTRPSITFWRPRCMWVWGI